MKVALSKAPRKQPRRRKRPRQKKRECTKELLNIVGEQRKSPVTSSSIHQSTMHKPNKPYNLDILKTRRLIINDSCNERREPTFSSYNHTFSFNNHNAPNVSQSSCVVQFSNTFLTQSTNPKFSNAPSTSVQNLKYTSPNRSGRRQSPDVYSKLPKRFACNQVLQDEFMADDDVVCLDSSVGDNSVITVNSRDASLITVVDMDDNSNNSIIELDTPTPTDAAPDLSKFTIVVTNSDANIPEQIETPEVNSKDNIICIDSENSMDWSRQTPIKKSKRCKNSVTIINNDTNKISLSVPLRRLNIPRVTNKHGIIYKKKEFRNKDNLPPCPKILTTEFMKFTESSLHREEKISVPGTNTKTTESLEELPETSEIILVQDEDKAIGNMYNPESISKNGLREIIIDGSNVALGHTNGISYSIEGLQIVIDYFVKRGHKVRAFVPKFRLIPGRCTNPDLLRQLVNDKHVILTPSRAVMGRRITPYDDRFIIQYATLCEGIVVSSDCYRDLINEKPEWRNTIENRLLMPTWIDNVLMFPDDPLGRFGPRLTEFLKFPSS